MKLERITEITPAFDKRHKNPSKNYGIHGVNLKFLVKGDLGVVQFLIYTNWQLPHVEDEMADKAFSKDANWIKALLYPIPADLGYHSPKPIYKDQRSMNCEYIAGGKCFYDGSGYNAKKPYKIMVEKGGEAMWKFLEKYYHRVFATPSPTATEKKDERK